MFHKLFSSATTTTIDICIMCVACKIQLLIVLSRVPHTRRHSPSPLLPSLHHISPDVSRCGGGSSPESARPERKVKEAKAQAMRPWVRVVDEM
jgi:hypothetical protein